MANPSSLVAGNKRGPSKTTTALKEAILLAAEQHGEDDNGTNGLTGYLRKVAREDVKAFSGLLGRVLPLQVTGEGGGPIKTEDQGAAKLAAMLDAIASRTSGQSGA